MQDDRTCLLAFTFSKDDGEYFFIMNETLWIPQHFAHRGSFRLFKNFCFWVWCLALICFCFGAYGYGRDGVGWEREAGSSWLEVTDGTGRLWRYGGLGLWLWLLGLYISLLALAAGCERVSARVG